MLRGEKVILRPIIKTDISLFLKWFNNPELLQYISLYLPMTEIEEEEWSQLPPPEGGGLISNGQG